MADFFSAVGTTIKLAEFGLRLKEVSPENRIFLNLIARVKKDLDEALRERKEKAAWLEANAGKRAWIDGVILDTRKELNSIGRLVEDARIDQQQGKPVTLKHRFDWVLTNHQKFVTEERALATFHHSLLAAISAMHHLTTPATTLLNSPLLPPPAYQACIDPTLEDLQENGILRSPFNRRPATHGRLATSHQADKQLSDMKTTSTLSLPEIEPMNAEDWTESLLRLPSEENHRRPGLSHAKSDSSICESVM
ncbi:MAG: hypothetical protein Q9182_004730 [Xanthomendoza sp. 2 TL-2023]